MNKQFFYFILCFSIYLFCISLALAASPNGADVAPGASDDGSGSIDDPDSHEAIAGNLTEIVLTGNSTTQSWQGYYGNVTGKITLKDSSGNVFYNWTDKDASSGEVFASTNDSIGWANVGCFVFDADADVIGQNLTTLETAFNIESSDSDGVDETFNLNNHAEFILASRTITGGSCNNTQLFGPNSAPTFDEVLMYDNSTNSTVFASLINETAGFDSATHDFQMLVLEDGHGTDALTTLYYFYIEI